MENGRRKALRWMMGSEGSNVAVVAQLVVNEECMLGFQRVHFFLFVSRLLRSGLHEQRERQPPAQKRHS